jgi:enterochelin esterase-like enzyme
MTRPTVRCVALVPAVAAISCLVVLFAAPAPQQTVPTQPSAAPVPAGRGRGGPPIVSPQIESDGRVTFLVHAPNATTVTLAGDVNNSLIPAPSAADSAPVAEPTPVSAPSTPGAASGGSPAGRQGGGRGGGPPAVTMVKGENGVWAGTTIRAVRPGAWRYTFNVDGAATVDARNVLTSPSQTQVQSLLVVPGDFSETRDVPHGAVASVRYVATALKNARREMFVYTPPAYEKGGGTYPVLYLIHGGGDTAVSWSTVGRANDILDNLIAEKKAVPMIVVMPSGWTPSGGQVMTSDATKDPFNDEMLKDIIPYVESRYRTRGTPDTRALSGLSMGGIQTLNVGLHNLGTFRYLAVMSSGWTTEQDRNWFYTNEAVKIPNYNKELRLFWWGWGESDIARTNGLAVIDALKKQGVKIQTMETPGGHEWPNWRLYLHEVAPKLFR